MWWFIEDQTFSSSYDLAPNPLLPTFSSVRTLDGRHIGRLRKIDNLLTEEGVGGGEGAKSYDGEKAWSSITHSILCGRHLSCYKLYHLHNVGRINTNVRTGTGTGTSLHSWVFYCCFNQALTCHYRAVSSKTSGFTNKKAFFMPVFFQKLHNNIHSTGVKCWTWPHSRFSLNWWIDIKQNH